MIIAVDGPAASGKSTTAREVARRLRFLHLESGAFYRAITFALLADGVPEATWEGLRPEELDRFRIRGARGEHNGVQISVGDQTVDQELRTQEVNDHVSHVARIPAVRTWLLQRLRDLAGREDVVSDGRDIGTVVFPDADVKVFLVADPEVRARRRLAERDIHQPDRDTLLQEIGRLLERDRIDSEREVAPLKKAVDAVKVDTTSLTFDEQVDAILELARGRLAAGRA